MWPTQSPRHSPTGSIFIPPPLWPPLPAEDPCGLPILWRPLPWTPTKSARSSCRYCRCVDLKPLTPTARFTAGSRANSMELFKELPSGLWILMSCIDVLGEFILVIFSPDGDLRCRCGDCRWADPERCADPAGFPKFDEIVSPVDLKNKIMINCRRQFDNHLIQLYLNWPGILFSAWACYSLIHRYWSGTYSCGSGR